MRGRLLAGWLGVLILTSPGLVRSEQILDLALIIGNNRYVGDSSRDLHYADDDALSAAEAFLALHPYGRLWLLVDPDEETLATRPSATRLEHRPPTLDAWDRAIQEMAAIVADARYRGQVTVHVFLHFSGHGERGGILHFADQRLPARSFRISLARVGADEVFALMDGCHLAQVVRDGDRMTTLPPPPIFDESEMSAPERPRWLGLIGATTAAPEHDYLASGLLTLVGLSALRGPADLDGDDRITFQEWGTYVAMQFEGVDGGPQVVVVPPRKNRRATVIDLRTTRLGTIRLEPGFPPGQVRIVQGPTRRLVAEVYHEGIHPTIIQVKPGHYTLLRFLPRATWRHPGYPAQKIDVAVGPDTTRVGRRVAGQLVVLLPEGMKGEGDPPENVEAWTISADEERAIVNSPFRRGHERQDFGRPRWTLCVGVPSPTTGPDLSGTGEPRPGFQVRAARTWPLLDRGPWFLGWGLATRLSAVQYAELWVNAKENVTGALHVEARVGPTITQTWALPRGRILLDLGVAYAPGVVADGAALLEDPSLEAAGSTSARYRFLRNAAGDVYLSWYPATRRPWNAGPYLMGEILRFQLPPISDAPAPVSWERTLAAGITVSW